MEKYKYVIVGNGIAGLRAADTIRQEDKTSSMLMISEEPYLSYSRPLISYLIGNEIKYDKMFYHDQEWYDNMNIKLSMGKSATKFEPIHNKLALSDGTEIGYEKLLIAVGGKGSIPDIPGRNLKGIFTFTHLDTAKEIQQMIKGGAKRAFVLGGGLVGLKAAQGLADAGVDVTVVISSGQVLSQLLDETAAALIKRRLDRKGIRVILNTAVVEVFGGDKVEGVILESGDEHYCDMVVFAKGVRPDLKYIKDTEIKTNYGIIADNHMNTNIPNVWAAGDCTETYEEAFGKTTTNLVWPRASEQGKVAALNMMGIPKEYRGWFWMNSFQFYGLSCISVGNVRPHGGRFEVMINQNLREGIYRKVVLQDDKIIGALFVGKITTIGTINGLIKKQIEVTGHKEDILEDKLALLVF
ncbi:MAG TPA: FAD-dependent oxidoreductase [Caldisericia bacterium]|nr:FAD-dependent oxidoreductase [Caldisericia bacterium]HPF49355.1 FAD-dependent oxidoreductase [Caldisericia bacterium]HPI84431.1 FAD-dependent oxidoreductase [Caldisericia bacterium]HPQ93808.1 FAD-dependent oxidoreductase [Caldisericia bacterium]HRV75628.1 FAD-dependent oxidoreductase [Caldisericia bacterium]